MRFSPFFLFFNNASTIVCMENNNILYRISKENVCKRNDMDIRNIRNIKNICAMFLS